MTTENGGHQRRSITLEDLPSVADGERHTGRPAASHQASGGSRRRRFRASWFILGGTLASFCALGVAVLVHDISNQQQVLVAARAIPAGHVFEPGDLRFASMSASGVDVIAASDQPSVLGRTAAVAIAPGAPLVAGDVGAPSLGSGTTVVAVLCKAGQFPPSLAAGEHVLVLIGGSAASGGSSSVADPSTPAGIVVAVDARSDAAITGTVITLQVGHADAAAIAHAGADGHVSLAVIGAGN